jgi:hypothetical protein
MSSIEKARAALAANPLPQSPWLEVTQDAILIKAGFSEQLLQMLRWVPRVEWRPDRRAWMVPLSGAETVRALLPEILRLAELTEPSLRAADRTGKSEKKSPREAFGAAARLLFGTDWQRDTARALGRDEVALARWLAGEDTVTDVEALIADMIALMQRRARDILAAADQFAAARDA